MKFWKHHDFRGDEREIKSIEEHTPAIIKKIYIVFLRNIFENGLELEVSISEDKIAEEIARI